jgi:hypothetical protein
MTTKTSKPKPPATPQPGKHGVPKLDAPPKPRAPDGELIDPNEEVPAPKPAR